MRRFFRLPGGIPSHDTFSRVFRLLEPAAFERCFARYVTALAERIVRSGKGGVVAVDGKTMRRSFDRQRGQRPLHLISAFACDTRLALGQRKVDGKSNEITALPEPLALLTLDGCIVTVDAMHCQKATAQAILERGGDYMLASRATRRRSLRTADCCSTIRKPRPPVEAIPPVCHELLHIAEIGAVGPRLARGLIREPRTTQPQTEIIDRGIRNIHAERRRPTHSARHFAPFVATPS